MGNEVVESLVVADASGALYAIPQDEVQGFALTEEEAAQFKAAAESADGADSAEAREDDVSGFLNRRPGLVPVYPGPMGGVLPNPDGTMPGMPTITRPRPPRVR